MANSEENSSILSIKSKRKIKASAKKSSMKQEVIIEEEEEEKNDLDRTIQ
jgi:hypothetical protein